MKRQAPSFLLDFGKYFFIEGIEKIKSKIVVIPTHLSTFESLIESSE